MKDFVEFYLKLLGFDPKGKIFRFTKRDEFSDKEWPVSVPTELSDYITYEATLSTTVGIAIDAGFKIFGGAVFLVADLTCQYLLYNLKENGNNNPDPLNALGYVSSILDGIEDPVDIYNVNDLHTQAIKSLATRAFVDRFAEWKFGTFNDREVEAFIKDSIDRYYDPYAAALKNYDPKNDNYSGSKPSKEACAAAAEYITELHNKFPTNLAALSGEGRDLLTKNKKDFIEGYFTTEDIYANFVIEVYKKVESMLEALVTAPEEMEAKTQFETQFPSYAEGTDLDNGVRNGLLDAFSQTYGSAIRTVYKGAFISELTFDYDEYSALGSIKSPLEHRMDIWNNEIGIRIGKDISDLLEQYWLISPIPEGWTAEQIKAHLDDQFSKYQTAQRAVVFEIGKKIREEIESGLIVTSIYDPRLQMLYSGDPKLRNGDGNLSLTEVNRISKDVRKILDNIQGGVESNGKNKNWYNIFENVIKYQYSDRMTSSFNYSLLDLFENDIPKYVINIKYDLEEAHKLLQLVTRSLSGSSNDTCDPKNDPFPENPDKLDAEISQYEKVGMFNESNGGVIGSVFKKENQYYIVFDNPQSEEFNKLLTEKDLGFIKYINQAYQLYREYLEAYRINADAVTLLGYGGGGAIASALSAALYCGAFTRDDEYEVYGHYDPALASFGWSLDKNGNIIDNQDAEYVNTLTFGAPAVKWMFQQPEIREKNNVDVDGNTIVQYYFDYPTVNKTYLDKAKDAPVTNYGMMEDEIFFENRFEFRIGKTVPLFGSDGKLPYVPTDSINWHDLDTLELALHDFKTPCPKTCMCGGAMCNPCECKGPPPPPPPTITQVLRVDPLIIDLNRDGKVSTTQEKVYFDLDANGIAERVSWAVPGDGFLVLDRDGDGKITSGLELFGDNTVMSNGKVAVSGFEALADLDSNGDGIIDALDAVYAQLRVWADKDGDGVFGNGEFYTLEELGIEFIDLRYTEENTTDENGNQIVRTGKVVWKGGDTSPISEFLLDRNTAQSAIYDTLEESVDIAMLPDISGRGYLYSLHQAMMRDESGDLQKLVEQFTEEGDPTIRRSLLDRIIVAWNELSDLESSSWSGWVRFLEKFYGGLPIGNPSPEGWRNMESNYEAVSLYLYGKLLQQTHYADLRNKLDYSMDEAGNLVVHIGEVLEDIAKGYAANPTQTKQSIAEFFLVLKTVPLEESTFFDHLNESDLKSYEQRLSTYGADLVEVCRASYLAMKNSSYIGEYTLPYFADGKGNPLEGDVTNNVLVGSDGNDVVNGGYGSDIFMGGKGEDRLVGGEDSDVYLWNLGDGNDTVINSTSGGETDVLRLGEGVHPKNVTLNREGNTIRLVIGESGEVVTLATDTSLRDLLDQDPMNPDLQLARVEFADGTVWTREYMLNMLLEFTGTDVDETIEGSVGADVLEGGGGDDTLRGNYGSDVYVWNLGDGNDSVEDVRFREDVNVLRLGGVSPDGVSLVRDRDSLVLVMTESGEKITLPKWYNQAYQQRYRLHRIEFEDGAVWTPEEMESFSAESLTIEGTPDDDTLDGSGGDDFLAGRGGDDLLRGGRGSDTYIWNPGDGNDTLEDTARESERNALRFERDVTREMVTFRWEGDDLQIIVGRTEENPGETITVKSWDGVENHKLAWIEFPDGSKMLTEEIELIAGDYIKGTDEIDVLRGSITRHLTLEGGKGDDILYGGNGGQTYVWKPGDGNDTIMNSKLLEPLPIPAKGSFLKFGPGAGPEDITLRCVDDNLVVTSKETGETITIQNWFNKASDQLKGFEFADGTKWTPAEIEAHRDKAIDGTDEAETITGFNSDDVLTGKKGDDVLDGRGGDDRYVWRLGDGNDAIRDFTGDNTLEFGEGIAPLNLSAARDGTNLTLTIGESGEKITLADWFVMNGGRLQRSLSKVEFANGEVWTAEDLEALLDKTIRGVDGEDNILEGYDWDDVFIGGKGNDILRGHAGGDTYIWRLGDGNDVIEEIAEEVNRLEFGEGIDPGGVHLRRQDNDLIVTVLKSGEALTLKDWFQRAPKFEMAFANGEVWDPDSVGERVDRWVIGTDAGEELRGTPGKDFIVGNRETTPCWAKTEATPTCGAWGTETTG
jgi:Ca2+-binding RTX toxin-like protein